MSERRFRVQRRVKITARDESNRKFLLAESWHTVISADRRTDGLAALAHMRKEKPAQDFRLVQASPQGRNIHIVEDWRSAPGKCDVSHTERMRGA